MRGAPRTARAARKAAKTKRPARPTRATTKSATKKALERATKPATKPATKSATKSAPKSATKKPKRKSRKDNPARGDAFALRNRILNQGARVFGKRGAEATTVEDILQAADISRRTFYRFFQSKDDVLDALHEIGCNMLLGAANQAASMPGDPVERLSRAVEAYLGVQATVGSEIMYVIQGESMRAGSRLGPRRRAFFDGMVEIFGREMRKATGLAVDPLLLRSLLVALEGVSMMLRSEGSFELERAKRVMLRIVMAAIAAPESGPVPALPLVDAGCAPELRATPAPA